MKTFAQRNMGPLLMFSVPVFVGMVMFIISPDAFIPRIIWGSAGWVIGGLLSVFALIWEFLLIAGPPLLIAGAVFIAGRLAGRAGLIKNELGDNLFRAMVALASVTLLVVCLKLRSLPDLWSQYGDFSTSIPSGFLLVISAAIFLLWFVNAAYLFRTPEEHKADLARTMVKPIGILTAVLALAMMITLSVTVLHKRDGMPRSIDPDMIYYERMTPTEEARADSLLFEAINLAQDDSGIGAENRQKHREWLFMRAPMVAGWIDQRGALRIQAPGAIAYYITCERRPNGTIRVGSSITSTHLTRALQIRLCVLRSGEF